MLKKIAACAAVLAVSITALTGCSGKLSTEETCTYLNDKAAEQNLNQKMKEASTALISGDTAKFKDTTTEAASLLQDVADRTSDDKLADALKLSADMTHKMAEAMAADGHSLMDMADKLEEFDTPELTAAEEYMHTACPSMPALD